MSWDDDDDDWMNFKFNGEESTMDRKLYNEILNYKKTGSYPLAISKEQKYVIRRRSARFLLDGKPL